MERTVALARVHAPVAQTLQSRVAEFLHPRLLGEGLVARDAEDGDARIREVLQGLELRDAFTKEKGVGVSECQDARNQSVVEREGSASSFSGFVSFSYLALAAVIDGAAEGAREEEKCTANSTSDHPDIECHKTKKHKTLVQGFG